MKECSRCKEVKELIEFSKAKQNNDGLSGKCKICVSETKREYHKKYLSRPDVKKSRKEYSQRLEIKSKAIARLKIYKEDPEFKAKKRGYSKKYYEQNKDKILEYHKERRDNPEYKAKMKEHRSTPSEKLKVKNRQKKPENILKAKERQQQPEHKAKVKAYSQKPENTLKRNNRLKERRAKDSLYKLKGNLISRTWKAFKYHKWDKESKTQEMLGVSYEIVKEYLERQFTDGMTWSNQGEWHVDHIIPLASAKDEETLRKLCHYTNLQPLWAKDNLEKSAKIIEGVQVKLRI